MEEMKNDETQRRHAFIKYLGITILAFLMLVSIAGAAPFAYITNRGSDTVSVIDTATNNVTDTVKVGSIPYGVAVNPDGTKVYVVNLDSQNVSVINTTTNTVIGTLNVGDRPYGITVSPMGARVYVTNAGSGTVSIIDTASNTVISTVPVGNGPFGIVASPDGKKVYVTNNGEGTVSVIDTATNSVIATVNIGTSPAGGLEGIAINPSGTKVYVAHLGSNIVSVIDTTTNSVTANVPVGTNPFGVAVSPDGKNVYVTIQGSNNVSVIDTATNTVTATAPVGNYPEGIAVLPDGTSVYVVNVISNNVSVIDTITNKVATSVKVGGDPIAFGQFIGPMLAPLVLPVANFSANVTSGYAPLSVQFTDLSVNATELNWDFGDGTISIEQNPVHTYSAAGTYTVNLTVINVNGTDSKSSVITVSNKPEPVLPVANFSTNVTSGYAPLTVQFIDLSTNATFIKWFFGDGNNSEERNPVHEFTAPGIYTVNLTASNENGTDSKLATINASQLPPLPVVKYSAFPRYGKAPLMVAFRDNSTGSPYAWKWTFGDGKYSTIQNPIHKYSQEGNYSVTLTVTNVAGSSSFKKARYIQVITNTRPGPYSSK